MSIHGGNDVFRAEFIRKWLLYHAVANEVEAAILAPVCCQQKEKDASGTGSRIAPIVLNPEPLETAGAHHISFAYCLYAAVPAT